MLKPKILVDLDACVYEIGQPMIDTFNEDFRLPNGSLLSKQTWTSYYLRDVPGLSFDIEKKVLDKMASRRIYRFLPLIPHVRASLLQLAEPFDPIFLTVREDFYPQAKEDTLYALTRDGFNFPTEFSHEKGEVARQMSGEIDFAIDDHLKHARQYKGICQVYLFDYPYNRDIEDKENGIIRVHGFEESSWWLNLIKILEK